MNYEIIEALGQIAREKSVDRKLLIETLEQGLLSAARKKFGLNAQVGVRFDEGRGGIEMWLTKSVAESIADPALEMTLREAQAVDPNAAIGQEVMIPLDIAEFGRNAIMAAKQVLVQRVREAEREMVYDEYVDKVGSLVRGIVQQVDRGSVFVKINLTEAVIPARELISRDRFRQRDHVRAYVLSVDKQSKGPQVILSRTHPDFLVKLFEAEVPEIADGIVEIKAVAREAGHRSKIAVYSRDDRIDAVGACVGIKGSRVQSIVRELGGERIDIVPWSSDPALFVSRALNPAKVLQASATGEADKRVTVVVVDDQLSLAIGKGGQNARLAARLTGWHIDLISQSENEARKKAGVVDVPVEELDGLTPKMAQKLVQSGIETAREVEKAGLAGLTAVEGVGEKTAEKLLATAVAALAALTGAGAATLAATEVAGAEAATEPAVAEAGAGATADEVEGVSESMPVAEAISGSVEESETAPPAPAADGDEAQNPGVEAEHSESMMESMEMKPEGEALLRGRGDDENKLWDDPDEDEEDAEGDEEDGEDDDDELDDEDEDFEEDDLDDLDIDLDDDDDDE